MSRFTDKVAVVTGAAQGIGAATALKLAVEGAAVAVLDRNAPDDTLTQIERAGGIARGYVCDVTDRASVQSVFDQLATDLGAPHILVNNAGITRCSSRHRRFGARHPSADEPKRWRSCDLVTSRQVSESPARDCVRSR
jgi:NAD(P)-dependent dehydrogenase (short-subunit alcohol dehydrogenase family)